MAEPRAPSTTFDWTAERVDPAPRTAPPAPAILPGAVIGGFRILGRIGEGGMGTVWEAEQEHPRRTVALKTIAVGQLSRASARRFRFEAEALATVLHWGIPQVYAAGDDQGRLYIAMERVEGTPLDTWSRGADRRQRIGMLASICDAVHHAHLRGIVHRDLKPSNVLVTADGRPKVVDFGIAAELGAEEGGAIVGTPAYMSPEQRSGARVDVRTDVWSLGVLAHELLGGQLPGTAELPPLGERDPSLRGDLEAVVARALRPDPDERYPSADALGADLRRHLAHEPVEARTATAGYVAGRWLRRHAVLAAATVVVFGALTAGLTVAVDAWRLAVAARDGEAAQRVVAEQARERAEQARTRAERVTTFLTDLLKEAHPDNAVGHEVTVEEALDRATKKLDGGDLADQPDVEIAVRTAIAWAYEGLGQDARVEPLLRAAVALRPRSGPTDDAVLATAYLADQVRGDRDTEALALLDQARADLQQLHARPHEIWRDFFHTLGRVHLSAGRYRDAEAALREALAEAEAVGSEDPTSTWNQLGHALLAVGRAEEAEALYRRATDWDLARYGPDHPQLATDWTNLGRAALGAGRAEEGLADIDRGLALRLKFLGPSHARTLGARLDRIDALLALHRPRDAAAELAEMEAAAHAGARGLGAAADLADAEISLALGDLDRARASAEQGLAKRTEELGPDHPRTAVARGLVGRVALARGDQQTATVELRTAREILERAMGPDAPEVRKLVSTP